jgi:phytoene synthase
MEMDLTVSTYDTWDDLLGYMDGSAAVIGEMMLPILDPIDPAAALAPARHLGLAFQLTNFLRDIDEDLDRGRPVSPSGGSAAIRRRPRSTSCDSRVRGADAIRDRPLPGAVPLGGSRDRAAAAPFGATIRAAHTVYGRILDRIESIDHDVFSARARVSTPTKLALTARQLVT